DAVRPNARLQDLTLLARSVCPWQSCVKLRTKSLMEKPETIDAVRPNARLQDLTLLARSWLFSEFFYAKRSGPRIRSFD
ncbi:hypothetical protein ACVBEH_24715, partial [Roseateles sp. GG27B]